MVDILVIIIVTILLTIALKTSMKQFKGESSCCNHNHQEILKKKLNQPIIARKVVKISGMHCQHCVVTVTNTFNKIDGINAKVHLKKQEAILECDRFVDDNELYNAIKKAGYTITSKQTM